ncbi:biotin transporter BioY [bacterium]|nr:biotin transporter BioY [bacterium]
MPRSRSWTLIPLFAALTAVGGFIRIPVQPAAFTLQTLFVYLAGSMLPARSAAMSQILFLAIGLAGLPIFAAGGGPGYILQPTFGYLLSFPIAAWIIAKFSGRVRYWQSWITGVILALVCIFSIGVCGMYFNFAHIAGKPILLKHAIWSGAILFIPAEIAKITLAAIVLKRWRLSNPGEEFNA